MCSQYLKRPNTNIFSNFDYDNFTTMAWKGGRVKSTWPKGQKSPVNRPKGSKNKKTILKERLGLKGWEDLKDFIETDGADKLVKEMKKLTGKSYVMAVSMVSEYVKPKLSRVDAKIKGDINLSEMPIKFE